MKQPPPSPIPWHTALWFRMRHLFWLKAIGTTAFMWVFFIGYFALLRDPIRPPTVMPLTALDHWIPLQPEALVAYASLWLYVGIAPGLLLGFWRLVVYGLWSAALTGVGLFCFWRWPTQVPPAPPVDVDRHPGFAVIQGVDAAGNACPSLHVATAVFAAVWIEHLLRQVGAPRWLRAINLLWVAAIVYSTLAVKQHVVLDALAGLALGLAFAWASLRWRHGEVSARPRGYDPSP